MWSEVWQQHSTLTTTSSLHETVSHQALQNTTMLILEHSCSLLRHTDIGSAVIHYQRCGLTPFGLFVATHCFQASEDNVGACTELSSNQTFSELELHVRGVKLFSCSSELLISKHVPKTIVLSILQYTLVFDQRVYKCMWIKASLH